MHPLIRPIMLSVALAVSGCGKEKAAEPPPSVLSEATTRLKALEDRYGEDAYSQKEVEDILKRLVKIPETSPEHPKADRLIQFLRAKLRLVLQADENRTIQPSTSKKLSYEPIVMEGEKPATPDQAVKADEIAVGATREALVKAYGSCLVRQTWFRGEHGH